MTVLLIALKQKKALILIMFPQIIIVVKKRKKSKKKRSFTKEPIKGHSIVVSVLKQTEALLNLLH